MPNSDYVTRGELQSWLQDRRAEENGFRERLEKRMAGQHSELVAQLGQVIALQREANGKTAKHAELIAVLTREVQAVKDEDMQIDKKVSSIQREGCHQYLAHRSMILGASSGLEAHETLAERRLSLSMLTAKQKAAAGIGVAALLIPAVAAIVEFMRAVTEWWGIHGRVFTP